MITARGLSRRFGPRLAVDEVTLEVAQGEIVALLGPNGAGKTTTMCFPLRASGGCHQS